jgi:hypothetical protein
MTPHTGGGGRVGSWFRFVPKALLATVALSLVTITFFWQFALRSGRDRAAAQSTTGSAAADDRDLARIRNDEAHFIPGTEYDSPIPAGINDESDDEADSGDPGPNGLLSILPPTLAVSENDRQPMDDREPPRPSLVPPTPEADSPPSSDKPRSTAAGVRALANPNAPAPERAGRIQVEEPMEPGGEKAIRFFGLASTDTQSVVYVIDCSGSMGRPELKLRTAKDELVRSIRALDPAQSFSVVFFSDHTYPMPMPGLVAATEANKERICEWVEGAFPRGGTYPLPAVLHALQLRPETIFVLSDGLFKGDYVREIRSNNRGQRRATIYTVLFGDHSGEPQMLRLARENGGSYRFVQPTAH